MHVIETYCCNLLIKYNQTQCPKYMYRMKLICCLWKRRRYLKNHTIGVVTVYVFKALLWRVASFVAHYDINQIWTNYSRSIENTDLRQIRIQMLQRTEWFSRQNVFLEIHRLSISPFHSFWLLQKRAPSMSNSAWFVPPWPVYFMFNSSNFDRCM